MEIIKYYDHYEMEDYVDQEQIDEASPITLTAKGDVVRENELFVWIAGMDVDYHNGKVMHKCVHCIVKSAITSRKKTH